MSSPSIVALIPARAGSKRVQGKNVRRLAGHPLLAYSIASARAAGIFDKIVVSTDAPEIADIARHYGATVPALRPAAMARDLSPDIEWLQHVLQVLADGGPPPDCFALLRPTSPFRQAETIRRAWTQFLDGQPADSLRAVEPCAQHPGKMWTLSDQGMLLPLLPGDGSATPWHSQPYQALPPVLVQNASLEIGWSRVPLEAGTISGTRIRPFRTEGHEGFDINQPRDWWFAEELIRTGDATLPPVVAAPWTDQQKG